MNPLISIIIPIYNSQHTISRCIESVIKQTLQDYEIILINDGSTDNSEFICKEYAKLYPQIRFFTKENGGVSQTRNYGLAQSKGKYITFVDADDFIEENYLEELYKGKDYDLAFINIAKYCLDKRQKENSIIKSFTTKSIKIPDKNTERLIIENDLLAIGFPWGKLFKKEIIDSNNLKFNEQLSNHEDHLFYFDYLIHCKTIYLSNCICYNYTYSINSKSLTHTLPTYQTLLKASNEFIYRYPYLFKYLDIKNKSYIQRITGEYGLATRRAAVYSLYYYKEPYKLRISFLKNESKIFKNLYAKYGYVPLAAKHLLIYKLICLQWITPLIKDLILMVIYHKNSGNSRA